MAAAGEIGVSEFLQVRLYFTLLSSLWGVWWVIGCCGQQLFGLAGLVWRLGFGFTVGQ